MHHDLFPETLLVSASDGHSYTTSLRVAEYFGKRHKDVLRAIARVECSEAFSRRNFAPRDYVDQRGKTQPLCLLTRDGFAFLAMGFTGPEAALWKERFLDAFNAMEAQLLRQVRAESEALFKLRAHWRTIRDGVARGLRRDAICQLTGHRSPNTITANKRRMRSVGLLLEGGANG